ncbi:hypothetical protein TWF788_006796 [Orbilia oligospora]|uniref:Uncharacterized protein n=1 Tax=Orbilia oligospora TaxID=2813651 RepID=A0A7C8U4M4_ORBOL|nr:hypothetical protein TWF788_006796 [Orbilia oligospora]
MRTVFEIEHASRFDLIENLQAQIRELQEFNILLPTKLYNSRLELATQQLHFPPVPISPGERQHLPNTAKKLRKFDVRECDAACGVLGLPIRADDTVVEKRRSIAEHLGIPSDFW